MVVSWTVVFLHFQMTKRKIERPVNKNILATMKNKQKFNKGLSSWFCWKSEVMAMWYLYSNSTDLSLLTGSILVLVKMFCSRKTKNNTVEGY